MRHLPVQERQTRVDGRRLQTGAMGASAAALGASMLLSGTAGSEQIALPTASVLPVTPDAAGDAAVPFLVAKFGGEPAYTATPAPVALPSPAIDPMTGAVMETQDMGVAAAYPTFAPLPYAEAPIPAMALVSNVQEMAQAQTAAAPTDSGSFWPDNHWQSSTSSGSWLDGLVSLGISGGAVAMIGGGVWLLWRYINTEPSFDDAIVYTTFEESPCSRVSAANPDADVVYVAPGKDEDGDDLTYSIIEYDTDDSSLLQIDAETGEVRFINDPLYFSPGDLDRDGVYKFVIEVEDEDGNTATQAVEMTITRSAPNAFSQTAFTQEGGTMCGDEFTIQQSSGSPSLFDIAGGTGNDLAMVAAASDRNFGVDMGPGEDTFFVDASAPSTLESILVDLGEGRDTIDLDDHVPSLVIQNFDEDDLIFLNEGVVATNAGTLDPDQAGTLDPDQDEVGINGTNETVLYTPVPATLSVQIFTSEADAVTALAGNGIREVAAYHNGEHSFILIEDTAGVIQTTIKLEDYILTNYDQVDVA